MTRKKIRILLCCALALAIFSGGLIWFLSSRGTLHDFSITPYISAVDKDGDGIDDQTDILQNAKAYVATKPHYESKYYATGYPDDKNGVCTDVVAFALKDAGYDLMELVNEHIISHPEQYPSIEKPDKNIDFRRVRNLVIYFDATAISLPVETDRIEEWQGGDIVIFPGHIGIVSDRRNRHGVPYVIHHISVFQRRYEEDILEKNTVIGHFRIS